MLPYSYNEDRLLLLPVDPNTLVAYWDFSASTWSTLVQEDATHLHLTLHCDGSSRTFGAGRDTRNYYFKGLPSDRDYWIELGYVAHGVVKPLMEGPPVRTPSDRPSENRLVQFRRFEFLTPPEQPTSVLSDWRESRKRGAERWDVYGELAMSLRPTGTLRTPPPGVTPSSEGPEALFYYYEQGVNAHPGGSSFPVPTSSRPTPGSHTTRALATATEPAAQTFAAPREETP